MKRPILFRVLIGYVAVVLVTGVPVLLTLLFAKEISSLGVLVAVAIGMGGGLIISLVLARRLSVPIRDLILAGRRVNSGDYNARVYLGRSDELGELAGTFNRMTQQMRDAILGLSEQREELNAVVVSLKEALIVIDEHERIVLVNDSFRSMVQNVRVEGRYYWELVRSTTLTEGVEKVRRDNAAQEVEFDLEGKTFVTAITPLLSRKRIMVVFKDVTEVRRVEKVKRDFVVNVSHELRTPLTAIKGFVEMLMDGVDEEHHRYATIVARNTDRLANIVEDLLQLSHITEEEHSREVGQADVTGVVEAVSRMFERRFREKGLVLHIETGNDLPEVCVEPIRLEQVLVNLVDNALKYTEKGQVRITVQGSGEDGVTIVVEDTGIGVSREHLPRLFERFYVVDKSRSRSLGGTGLGLSIVKHIVASSGGSIQVESTLGVGSKFTVWLPAADRGTESIS